MSQIHSQAGILRTHASKARVHILNNLPDDLYRFIIQKWVFPNIKEELNDLGLSKFTEHTVIRGNEKAWSFFGQHIFYSVEQVNRLNRLNILKETLVEGYF